MELPSFLQPMDSYLGNAQTSIATANGNSASNSAAGNAGTATSGFNKGVSEHNSIANFLQAEAAKAGLLNPVEKVNINTATSSGPGTGSGTGTGTGSGTGTGTGSGTGPSDKLKFMLVGTHCHQYTGYSKVTYGFIKELAKVPYLDIVHFGFQKHPQVAPLYRPYPLNVKVIDAAALEKPIPGAPPPQGFGYNILPDVIRKEQPNVVLIYNDMGVVARFIEEIRKSGIPRNFKIWVYVDQVYNTQLQAFIDVLNRDADRIFAFTSYWKKCIKDQGVNRSIDVLGHGFEADVFQPMSRLEARKKAGLTMIPEDGFIMVNVNRNQPRKRYDLLLMAFAELVIKYPTKPIFLLCICDRGEKGGWPLHEIYARELKLRGVNVEQFLGRLLISSQDMVFKDEDINMFYNLADIGVTCADGEGWGLCAFEQMGVGVPQVVPDVGGFKEFCNAENSILVKPKHRMYLPLVHSPVGGEAEIIDPHDYCLGIEEYMLDSQKRKAHGVAARAKVTSYTWEKVVANLIKRLRQEHEDREDE